jgi:hypothetical protein
MGEKRRRRKVRSRVFCKNTWVRLYIISEPALVLSLFVRSPTPLCTYN